MDVQGIDRLYQRAQSDLSGKEEEDRRNKAAAQERLDEFRQKLTLIIEQKVQDLSAAERFALATAVWERPNNVILGSRGPCSQQDSVMARMRILLLAAHLGHKKALEQIVYLAGNINYAVCLTESERKTIAVSAWIWAALSQSAPADDSTIKIEAKHIFAWLEQGAAKKDPDSIFALAEAYILGRGVERDVEMSYKLHTIAAALGHSESRARSISIAKAYGISDTQRTLPDNLADTKLIAAVPDPSASKQVAAPHSVLSGHYIDNRDGTVTDTTTGLMWMRFALGQTWDGNTGVGKAQRYSWEDAKSLHKDFAGSGLWRLPDIEELKSIVVPEKKAPAIDSSAFPNTPSLGFWSGSASANDMKSAWSVRFTSGYAIGDHRAFGNCVRLVRSVQSPWKDYEAEHRATREGVPFASQPTNAVTEVKPGGFEVIERNGENLLPVPAELDLHADVLAEEVTHQVTNDHFVDNGDGTVTDTSTGLMWMRCAFGQIWDGTTCTGDALAYKWKEATALRQRFAGFDNWRLPDLDEFESLITPLQDESFFDKETFPNSPKSDFWTSSFSAYDSLNAWSLSFEHGHAVNIGRDNACHVRLVRAGNRDKDVEVNRLRAQQSMARKMPVVAEQDSLSQTQEIIKRLELLESNFTSAIGRMESLLEHPAFNQTAVRVNVNPIVRDPSLNAAYVGDLHRKLTNAVQLEMLKRAITSEIQRPASPATYTSLSQFLHGLIELEDISLADLRQHLLPLDLLPSAVIEEINEIAFDLVGEAALEEDGDRVIVYREVLVRVLKTWDAASA